MAHSDDIAAPHKDVGLAKRDASGQHLRGPGDNEETLAVLLELGSLVRLGRIFDGKIMKAELLLHLPQQLLLWVEQADPHDMARSTGPFACLLDGGVSDAPTLRIDAGSDDAMAVIWDSRR